LGQQIEKLKDQENRLLSFGLGCIMFFSDAATGKSDSIGVEIAANILAFDR
jgi:hypothetical protein